MNPEFLLKTTVFPSSNKDEVVTQKDRLWVFTKSPASNGLANKGAQELIAHHFGVPSKNVILIKGSTSPSKLFKIYGPVSNGATHLLC